MIRIASLIQSIINSLVHKTFKTPNVAKLRRIINLTFEISSGQYLGWTSSRIAISNYFTRSSNKFLKRILYTCISWGNITRDTRSTEKLSHVAWNIERVRLHVAFFANIFRRAYLPSKLDDVNSFFRNIIFRHIL